jgi:hypothetical protein
MISIRNLGPVVEMRKTWLVISRGAAGTIIMLGRFEGAGWKSAALAGLGKWIG